MCVCVCVCKAKLIFSCRTFSSHTLHCKRGTKQISLIHIHVSVLLSVTENTERYNSLTSYPISKDPPFKPSVVSDTQNVRVIVYQCNDNKAQESENLAHSDSAARNRQWAMDNVRQNN